MDSCPIICITGQVATPVIGTDAFQETPIVETCRAVTKHHYLVQRTEDIPRIIREAFHIATTGRPGPVIVDVPKDVQTRQIVPEFDAPMNLPGYKPYRRVASHELCRVLELIRGSKRPIIYGGGGLIASEAGAHLVEFATHLGIPVALTLHGLGSFPADHYLCLQMLGMHGTVYSNYAINEADLLLAFGVRFDDRVTGKLSEFAKHGKIVHIDIDPSELNKNKPALVPLWGDIKDALADMNQMLKDDSNADLVAGGRFADWFTQIDEWREAEPMQFQDRDDAILPQYAIHRLWQILKERNQLDQTIVTTGVGQHQMWAAQYFHFNQPRHWITSGGLGAMGFGLPSALGAQAAHPSKLVVDIDGDGSFLMNIQELACAYTENLPVKVLLLNNQHLGMVVQWEDRFFKGNRAHTYLGPIHHPEARGQGDGLGPSERYPDFVTIAKGYGCGAAYIRNKADLVPALEEMINYPGPYVLDVEVPYQEHVLPMIPSGHTVRDMIKE